MVRILVDDYLRNCLHYFREVLELCDEQGQIVAIVTLAERVDNAEGWVQLTEDLTEEEYLRASQSTECGISTAELLQLMSSQ